MKRLFTSIMILSLFVTTIMAQVPNISYTPSTVTLATNAAMTALTMNNSGGAIPSASLGLVTTVAGTTTGNAADGIGTAAILQSPQDMCTDNAGNIYFTEYSGNTIRKYSIATGAVTTIAGTLASQGYVNGTGTAAKFYSPCGIVCDGLNLYIADQTNGVIRKMVLSTGVVTTLTSSGGMYRPTGLVLDGAGYLYVSDYSNCSIYKMQISTGATSLFAGNGSSSGFIDATGTAARFNMPWGMTTDGTYLYVAEVLNYRIRKINLSTAAVTTLAGNGTSTCVDGTGTAATIKSANFLTYDGIGNLYFGDNTTIRKINTSTTVVATVAGAVSTFAYTDGIGAAARFNSVYGLCYISGVLYEADGCRMRTYGVQGSSISPALPTGLSFSTTTGTISGTPTATSAATNYTVTATNSDGTSTTIVNITIASLSAPVITYSTPKVFTNGYAITSLTPTSTGGAVASYSVSPALPAGLSLNSSTGVISGAPSAISVATNYTVTATNAAGTATFVINITVNDVAPSALSYTSPNVYPKGTAISILTPTVTRSVVSYSVSPALPAGLSLNTTTGAIGGTPTTITSLATYTVTATNSGGSTTFGINITITDAAPTVYQVSGAGSSEVNGTYVLNGKISGFDRYAYTNSTNGLVYQFHFDAADDAWYLSSPTQALYGVSGVSNIVPSSGWHAISGVAPAPTVTAVSTNPTISSFTPSSGVSGSTVTITGTNFIGATAVTIGGTAASSFSVVSATSITAVVASGTTGTIIVTTPSGAGTSASTFTCSSVYEVMGAGTAIANGTYVQSASLNDGVSYYVKTGSPTMYLYRYDDFYSGKVWAVGSVLNSSNTNDQAYYKLSAAATPSAISFSNANYPTGLTPTPVVSVTNPIHYSVSGAGTTNANGVYTEAGTNDNVSYFIKTGSPTMYLQRYYDFYNGSTWAIASSLNNSDPAYFKLFSSPATPSGITFTDNNGTSGVSPNPVVSTANPIVSISPSSATVGSTITLSGYYFSGAAAVTIGGTPVTSFTVVDANTITAVVASGNTGTVSVTTPSGTFTSATSFTVLAAPATQAMSLVFSNVQTTQMTIAWTNGNGAKRAVFVKEGAGSITNPSNNSTYTANANWTSKGTQLGTSGYYCVYNGIGNTFTVTGLTQGTNYSVQVFEYNGAAGSELYNVSSATDNPKSQSTVADIPTGTEQLSASIAAYPTPSKGKLTVQLNAPLKEKTTFNVVDLNGKSVYSTQATAGTRFVELNLSSLNNGVYIVNFLNDKQVENIRFVIEK